MSYRNANPLSAFLAGFETVNRLEDARDQRAWNKTQRSRMADMWDRADDEYEYLKLERYREKLAGEADAIADDILTTATQHLKATEALIADPNEPEERKAQARKVQAELKAKWFGVNSQANLINETWKRQGASNGPEFYEHLSRAFGKDAAAGPLVRDPKTPVSGAGYVAPTMDFDGGVFFEIDSVNGKQPMTELRSSAPNDKVFFGQPGMAELVKVYGQSALTDKYKVLAMLRTQLGGNTPTGNPLESQDRKQARGGAASGAADSKAGAANSKAGATTTETTDTTDTSPAKTEQEVFDERLRQQDMERVKAGDIEGMPEDVLDDLEARLKKSYGDQFRTRAEAAAIEAKNAQELARRRKTSMGMEPLASESLSRTVETGLMTDTPISGGGVAELMGDIGRRVGIGSGSAPAAGQVLGETMAEGAGMLVEGSKEGSAVTDALIPRAVRDTQLNKKAAAGGKALGGFISGFVKGVSGKPDTLDKALESEEELNEVANAQGVDPKDFAADAGEKGQANSVAAPASQEAAAQIANSLVASQGSGPPQPWNVYEAYQMQQVGLISGEELIRFKRTGQLSAPAEAKIKSLGNGNYVIQRGNQFEFGTHPNAGGAGGGDKPATVQDHAALQALYEKYTQDIEDPGYQQSVIGAMQGAATILGADNRSKQDLADRANISVSSMLRGGMNLINRFDEDTIQGLWDAGNIDWRWGDFEIDMNAGNIAVASEIYMAKVGDKKQVAHALRDYTRDFKGIFPGMSDQRLAYRTGQIEQKIKQGLAMAQQNGTGVIPVEGGKSVTVEKGDTRHEIRQKIFATLKGN